MPLFALTTFLSAFLLFQIQPMTAKVILPWFGGSAAVWTNCMLFFQGLLLAGYGYSDLVIHRLNPKQQAIVHTTLLTSCLLLLPVLPGPEWKPAGEENPTLHILVLLAGTVGLPYLMLSTTGPLIQAWYARSHPGGTPYRLFALSNLGSMLALLTYPPLVEPYLATNLQGFTWSGLFVLFTMLCLSAAWRSSRFEPAKSEDTLTETADQPPTPLQKFQWILLAACPSLLMLAVTNHLTQDVAAIPFLWIVPLTIYLLSFILAFDAPRWYVRGLFLALTAPALGGMAYMQWSDSKEFDIRLVIAAFAAALLVACMVCHGELARRKPSPRHLTGFYLMLSIGGALGGLFVGVVAPYVFPSNFELPIGVALCALLVYWVALDDGGEDWRATYITIPSLLLIVGVVALCVFLARTMRDEIAGYVTAQRNFYGTLRIREHDAGSYDGYRSLLHGSINHGEQWTHPSRQREPVTYYCRDSGIGRVMMARRTGIPQKVGVLGLGAGTMAVFGRAGDEYRFYEINPLVPGLARKYFTYLTNCPAKLDIAMGDGRLSLERESPQQFDVLMMDAFSGDSIPIHLVTVEAFAAYFRHLKPDGIIVVHISNKYLDLEPVIAAASRQMGKASVLVDSDEDEDGVCFGTTYVLVANTMATLQSPLLKGAGRPAKTKPGVDAWTDSYSNLYRIVKSD
jgi:hypothetical protein